VLFVDSGFNIMGIADPRKVESKPE
jgi:hypothetical protein